MLENFLATKPLYYDKIDYDRMPRIYTRIKNLLPKPKIIHLVGTNGKGTTGRFLATALYNNSFHVGHYTSPHITDFGERIWLDGKNATKEMLDKAHIALQTILTQEESNSLSYFEYTTFLAMILFKDMDYVVLEAGLGGERDATAVFEKTLTLVTPIAKDHEAFLGDTIESIATTKLKAIQKNAILAKQMFEDVYKVATKLQKKYNFTLYRVEETLSEEDKILSQKIVKQLSLPLYQKENLEVALSALNYLGVSYKENDFNEARLFGRLTQFRKNIILDVGHNLLATEAILKALQPKKYVLIYNTYKDKDYKAILKLLEPIIKRVEIIEIVDERIEKKEILEKAISEANLSYSRYEKISDDEQYLVFGSFKVVEAFLEGFHG
jgi:dihydrofolate synthase/folylpolyglutamate synthase